MSNQGISFPSTQAIEQWNDISKPTLPETSAKSVPSAQFVTLPNEPTYQHSTYANTELHASEELRMLQRLDDLIDQALPLINQFYTSRSIGNPLFKFFGRNRKDPKLAAAVRPFYDQVFNLVKGIQIYSEEVCSEIIRILKNEQLWQSGMYSDHLLDKICLLFDKLAILDELHVIKSGVINDFTFLAGYIPEIADDPNHGEDLENRTLRVWLSTHCSIESSIVSAMTSARPDSLKLIFGIFWAHIKENIDFNLYIVPEMLYAYLRTTILFARIYPDNLTPEDFRRYLILQANIHPLLPLVYEMSTNFRDRLSHIEGFKIVKFDLLQREMYTNQFNLNKAKLLTSLTDLPGQISLAKQNDKTKFDKDQFYSSILAAIKVIGTTKNLVREQLSLKLALPPEDATLTLNYEKSLRKGYNEEELRNLLQVITLWRSLHDLLEQNKDIILDVLSTYFNDNYQNCVLNVFDKTMIRTRKLHENLETTLIPVRELLGDYPSNAQFNVAYSSNKNVTPHPIAKRESSPSPTAVEFLRISLSHLINNGSQFAKNSRNIPDRQLKKITDFLNLSHVWVDLLNLEQILNNIGDQSDLYFKEVQLDLNKVINFPIRASLPFILCEFALNNYMQPELTELLFYPLGIYDDANRVAQQRLKSSILMEEIKAESMICLKTLGALISDFTFGSFRTFVSLRSLSPQNYNLLQKQFQEHWPDSRAYRLTTLLQQNQFFLLNSQIEINSLIVKSIEGQIMEAIEGLLITTIKRIGISALIAITREMEILKLTHELLTEQNIPLFPFKNMISIVMGNTSPDSFISNFIIEILTDIVKTKKKTYFRTSPLRLVHKNKHNLNPSCFGQLTLGKIMKTVLEPSVNLITVEHMSCLNHLLDDGGVLKLIGLFASEFEQTIDDFTKCYSNLKGKVPRIIDANPNMTGQLQFDRYEGVYKFFQTNEDCLKVFELMKQLGNMLAIATMIDVSDALKQISRLQIINYFKVNENVINENNNFIKILLGQSNKFDASDLFPPLLTTLLTSLTAKIDQNDKVFAEYSHSILDFSTLTGFGATWSVLEFVFCLMEALRNSNNENSPFESYGEGVMFSTAAILAITNQKRIHFATNIGRRIVRVKDVDFAAQNDPTIVRFCNVFQLETNSLNWAMTTVMPIIEYIRATTQ